MAVEATRITVPDQTLGVAHRQSSAEAAWSDSVKSPRLTKNFPRLLGAPPKFLYTDSSSIRGRDAWAAVGGGVPVRCWSFSARMSVDQDLTVVAEAIDDDVVKQRLVPIVFTRA